MTITDPMRVTILADADFVIRDARTAEPDTSVVVEDRRIGEVGQGPDIDRRRPSATVIDCRGMIVFPGLINAHTHLYQILGRGLGKHLTVRDWAQQVTYPIARRLTATEYYDAVLLACADAMRNGTTALVDHTTHYARFHADQSCRALSDAGLRGAVARGGADMSVTDPGENRPFEEDVEAVRAFVERWRSHPRVRPWVGPSGFHTCRPESLRRWKALADELGTRLHVHIAETIRGRPEAQAAGFAGEASWADSLGLLDPHTSIAHAVWVDADEMKILARRGVGVVHCPTSNQILASGIARIPEMRELGVTVALATDGPSSNDSLDMAAELKSCALIHRAQSLDATIITAQDAFRFATEGGATVLGEARLGRIEPGYAADLVAVRLAGNPSLTPCHDPISSLAFHGSGRDVALVMVDGRVLFQDGRFTMIDVPALITRVQQTVRRLRAGPGR
jgi:5-methylthioadenosine/S-adenosylhomocysteine deaminase